MLWQTGLGFDNLGSILYLPTLRHYAWVSHLWTIDINLTHQGQFLTPDSQIQTSCSEKTSFHFRFVMYYFFALYNNRKSFQMPTIRSNRKYLEYLQTFSAMFESLRKIVWNLRKWLGRFWKSRSWRDKNLTHLTHKKLAGIVYSRPNLSWVLPLPHSWTDRSFKQCVAGSIPSLAAGLAFGGISAVAAYQTNSYPRNAWVMLGKLRCCELPVIIILLQQDGCQM